MTTLYKQNKNKSIQQWSIRTVPDGKYEVIFGQLGGAMQRQVTQCTGKNLGKANETTPEQQAELEVQSIITKKRKSGYVDDQSGKSDIRLPMKVKSYQDQLHNITFPCYSQFKYNGVNGLYRRVDNKLTLYSRGGEVYPVISHLEQAINAIMDELNCTELNGELYIHNTPLQDIQSAVTKPNELSPRLTFIIFDIADDQSTFETRYTKLQSLWQTLTLIGSPHLNYIGLPNTVVCNSTDDIEAHYNKAMSQNYEGTVIKLPHGLYKHNIRSSEQFKYKKALSAEFLIASYELDKRDHPVFILNTGTQFFKAKPKGTHEYLASINPQDYVNQWATCEYETISKSGIPLKPIFIGLRKCDKSGNPLE